MKKLLFIFLFFIPKIICDGTVSADSVINTCGKLGYGQPQNSDDCKEDGEWCCFAEIKDTTSSSGFRKFCVSSPSDIELDDVKDDIKTYTGYEITGLKCNESQFIMNNVLIIFALFVFMIF